MQSVCYKEKGLRNEALSKNENQIKLKTLYDET
jgi:hypothetical protein